MQKTEMIFGVTQTDSWGYFMYFDRQFCLRVDPQERVLPVVRKLNLHEVAAFRASRASRFEYCVRAYAVAFSSFKNQCAALIDGYSRRTACLAHFRHALMV